MEGLKPIVLQRKCHRTRREKSSIFCDFTPLCVHSVTRVWKGIFGIQDLTKIWCGNRENDKYIDGIWDLTAPREVGLAKNWARDAGFMFVCPETVMTNRS